MTQIAIQSLIKIIMDMIFIGITFMALRGVRTEKWLRKNYVGHGQILYIFASIAIGYTVSNFIYDLVLSSRNLIFLFQ